MWWCPGSRWRHTWRTCTPIDPPLHRPQAEEEPRPDPPPPAPDGSAPGPAEEKGLNVKNFKLKLSFWRDSSPIHETKL